MIWNGYVLFCLNIQIVLHKIKQKKRKGCVFYTLLVIEFIKFIMSNISITVYSNYFKYYLIEQKVKDMKPIK